MLYNFIVAPEILTETVITCIFEETPYRYCYYHKKTEILYSIMTWFSTFELLLSKSEIQKDEFV